MLPLDDNLSLDCSLFYPSICAPLLPVADINVVIVTVDYSPSVLLILLLCLFFLFKKSLL